MPTRSSWAAVRPANPLPLAPFFDAFFVGEAEGRLAALAAALDEPTRARRLRRLGAVPGVFLPHDPGGGAAAAGEPGEPGATSGRRVSRQVFTDFSSTRAGDRAAWCRCSRGSTTAR